MVFEVMLAKILEGYLGDYIENLDTKNLRVALWGGNVELENLRFKSSALADVSSSLSVKAGFLRKLKLFVPWNSFYTQTVKVEVDGLYLLIVPKSDVKYDREKVENENYDIKMRQIRRVEIMRKEQENMALQQKDNVDISKETNTFAERLQMHIVRNLDLTIKNIHIRMEDQSTKPNSPFTFGLTLSTIQLKTTDENWQPATLASDAPFVNKLVEVVKFSLYWNSSDKCLSQLPNDKIINELENLIPNDQTTTAMDFILSPMSVDAKLKMDTKPKLKNFKEPMIILNTTLKTIRLNLITSQYFDMLDFMEAYEFRSKTFKYAPYRHWLEEGEASRSKRRWKFAIDAILDDTVKPKFDCWKWENMKIHLKMCREYRKLFVRESTNKLSDVDAARMRELELKLNIFNLTLVRSSAQKEVDKRLEDLQKKKTWGAWVQSFWKQEEETVELSEEVTEAEKSKLFEAIGYVGDETSYSSYPKEYIQAVAEFTLSELSLTFWKSLNNGRSSKGNTQILTAQVLDSFVKLSRRPTLNAFKTDLQMKEVRFLGLDEGNGPAPLVVTNETGSVNDALLSASFETNPMNSDAKFFFGANCSSVGIYYHSESINCLVSSFVTRDRKQLSSMKAAAYSTYVEAKQRTKLLLKHNLEHVKLLDIDIYLRSSYFILPNLGKYSKYVYIISKHFGAVAFTNLY
ncbi:hypothetical protein GJ496_007977 [Pomphorhynchus laevis]|nr:hypothetical protein GJ496_007977 [Pomphorhynchus laevis]